jgi:hypothetical protein
VISAHFSSKWVVPVETISNDKASDGHRPVELNQINRIQPSKTNEIKDSDTQKLNGKWKTFCE